ncbi:MAG: response regulator transcription factor [Pseudomonadota bacterium]
MTHYTILVIDDDPDIRAILRDNLELDGYAVLIAPDGKAGLDNFHREMVDLVILDLMLPDMDGIQVCRAIRSRSTVSIIMLTAKDGVSDKVLGLEHGADDYIVKPFDYLELAARIKARLRRSKQIYSHDSARQCGPLRMFSATYEVELNGRLIRLTPKEFELLGLLVRFAGQPLDREDIRKEIWPKADIYRWSRTIDVHIQHLRAKLTIPEDCPELIRTVPGIGYMLSVPAPR